MTKLAIVVLAYNNWSYTKQCLSDLLQLPEDHSIILVDNASSDETKNVSKIFNDKKLDVIVNEDNYGFAKGCNIGFKKAQEKRSENVMFLNNDIRVRSEHKNWTDRVLSQLSSKTLLGPTVGILDGDLRFVCEAGKIPEKYTNTYMSGWCVTATMETWNELVLPGYEGPFSEEFGKAFFEDSDLGFRARNQNIKFNIVDIPVHHFGHKTTDKLNTNELYKNAREIFVRKWKK
jgi:GT2 family glycosyltransferase